MKRKYNRIPSIACPHCGARAITRDSAVVDRLTRDLWLICQNIEECGHTFVAQLSVIRTVRQSARPDPVVADRLPVSAWGRKPPAENDNEAPQNDNSVPAAESTSPG